MGRRKKLDFSNPVRVKELGVEHNVDALRDMMQLLSFSILIPLDAPPELVKKMVQEYRSEYELVFREDGRQEFRPKLSIRVGILKEIIKYQYPQLKSTETKVESDTRVTVIVKNFEVAPSQTVVESVVRAALPEAIEAEEVSQDA